jgi:anti-anti-sigma factor
MTWLDSASDPPHHLITGSPGELVTIEVEFAGAAATVVISGDLDLVTKPLLADCLSLAVRQKPRRLVLDMAGTSFMDCGCARLVAGTGRFLPASGQLVIRHPSRAVRRVFELTGLDIMCDIDREEPA